MPKKKRGTQSLSHAMSAGADALAKYCPADAVFFWRDILFVFKLGQPLLLFTDEQYVVREKAEEYFNAGSSNASIEVCHRLIPRIGRAETDCSNTRFFKLLGDVLYVVFYVDQGQFPRFLLFSVTQKTPSILDLKMELKAVWRIPASTPIENVEFLVNHVRQYKS